MQGLTKFEKNFPKPLDKKQILCYNKDVRKRKDTSQTRKATAMKKASLSAVYSALKSIDFDSEILAEIEKELTKGEEQKAKNAALYDSFKGIVMNALSMAENPVTIAELWDSIASEVPEGVTKSKVQYAVTRLWVDEIVKTEGKVNTYSLKA